MSKAKEVNYLQRFAVKPDAKVRLKSIDAAFSDIYKSNDEVQALQKRNNKRLNELQELLYAEQKRSLLICFQAMDAGGKDGVIQHVIGAMNPQGCKVFSFKKPTSTELSHDFMWRAYRDLPGKGEVTVFNRSHYEDVLVVKVHDLIPKQVLAKRYDEINAIEQHLSQNNTHILKFYLHIDKDEQLKRFKDRLDDPSKHWKISGSDYQEREYWDDYMKAFEAMLSKCSTKAAPWFVIPANHKWFRDFAVSQILVEYLEGLNMQFSAPTIDLKKIRQQYYKAAKKRYALYINRLAKWHLGFFEKYYISIY